MQITLNRKNQAVHFEAVNEAGQTVQIDGSPDVGGEGKGLRPMQLMLMSVAGCSAIDVVNILKKQRQKLDEVKIVVTGEREKGKIPSLFTDINLEFHFNGEVETGKADYAIKLTMEKYCSASRTVQVAGADLTYSIHINGEEVKESQPIPYNSPLTTPKHA